jgi:6-phosphogluconolactonase/glucosamine-6-phosphate isomerase/deaminase
MKILKCEDPQKAAIFANIWCEEQVKLHNSKNLFIPAGKTPVPLYQLWEKTRPPYLDKLNILQLDEIINGPHKGIFRRFFEQYLVLPENWYTLKFLTFFTRSVSVGSMVIGAATGNRKS